MLTKKQAEALETFKEFCDIARLRKSLTLMFLNADSKEPINVEPAERKEFAFLYSLLEDLALES